MKNNIYVLNQRQDETFDAAGKAMRDVFSVLADKKAKIIWSVPKHCSKYLKLLDLPYLVLFLLFCLVPCHHRWNDWRGAGNFSHMHKLR